jgi:Domain of unknown function (DUF4170)
LRTNLGAAAAPDNGRLRRTGYDDAAAENVCRQSVSVHGLRSDPLVRADYRASGIDLAGAARNVRPGKAESMMAQLLHLVFGGELVDPQLTEFRDPSAVDLVGLFPDYRTAYDAWKAKAQGTVDDAHTRYFIAHLHRLTDEGREVSPTEKLA